jgi:dolichyl-phosphate beta-glucosyltransferase
MVMDHTKLNYKSKKLSIIIPAFNEERRLLSTLEKIYSYFEKRNGAYEIIVVDDGSTDNTSTCANDFRSKFKCTRLVRNGGNRGKGYSVKNGFLQATGEYLLFSDADLSTPIEEIEKLKAYLENGYDIAIGSRGLKESDIQVHQPWYREIMGRTFNILVRVLCVRDFKDTQCGFKCFIREAALEVCKRQRLERFSFDVEMLYIAKKLGYKVKEVPVRWVNESETKVKAIRDSANMFVDLLKIKLNDITGKYD